MLFNSVSDLRHTRVVSIEGRLNGSHGLPPEPARRVSVVRWSSLLCEQLVRIVDVLVLMLAGVAVGIGRAASSAVSPDLAELVTCVVLTATVICCLVQFRSYRLVRFLQVVRPVIDVAVAVAVTSLLAQLALMLMPEMQGGQGVLLAWTGTAFVGLALVRAIERPIVAYGVRRGVLRRKVVVVGATSVAEHLIGELRAHDHETPSEIIGIYDDRGAAWRPGSIAGIPVRGGIDALCDYASERPVDLILIALPWQRAMDIFSAIRRVQWISADVIVPLEEGTFHPRTASVASVGGEAVLMVARQPLRGIRSLLKLVEDYVIAGIGIVLAAPLMLICAVAIKLDSAGPVLFRQTRVGYNNHHFSMFKFRTMIVDPNDRGVIGVGRHDPRITRVGGILRRLSLDEVPQLFNVLRGEMSVVGPRAHVPGMLVSGEEYAQAVTTYAARHRIKPGITGLAQINGMRGGIHSLVKARRGVELDMTYVENWSLGLDFRIMARTLLVGMFGSKVF